MKTKLLLCLLCGMTSNAAIVTYFWEGPATYAPSGYENIGTNSIVIAHGEILEVLSIIPSSWQAARFIYARGSNSVWVENPVGTTLAGPATVICRITGAHNNGGYHIPAAQVCVTARITSTAYQAGQAVVVPPETQSVVYLETSTNLLHWTPACSVSTSNAVSQQFFRIRADR